MSGLLTDIQGIVCRVGNLPAVDATADFYDAGLPSVNALTLLIELEDAYSVSIPDGRFIQARTVRDLADMIENLQREHGE